jgi:putative hemolysin
MKAFFICAIIAGLMLLVGCGAQPTRTPEASGATPEVPNPASDFCLEQGYQYEIRPEEGAQVGYCLFPDGTECEQWAFYRSECGPAATEPGASLANPASKYCQDQGYRLEMRTDARGTAGYCIFPDGSECEEWAFYRLECKPGTSAP